MFSAAPLSPVFESSHVQFPPLALPSPAHPLCSYSLPESQLIHHFCRKAFPDTGFLAPAWRLLCVIEIPALPQPQPRHCGYFGLDDSVVGAVLCVSLPCNMLGLCPQKACLTSPSYDNEEYSKGSLGTKAPSFENHCARLFSR